MRVPVGYFTENSEEPTGEFLAIFGGIRRAPSTKLQTSPKSQAPNRRPERCGRAVDEVRQYAPGKENILKNLSGVGRRFAHVMAAVKKET
jgi:hypothetical protein